MNRKLLTGAAIVTLALATGVPKTADAFRGGFGGGGFHGEGGGAERVGGAGGEAGGWHAEGGAIGVEGGASYGGAVGVEGGASYGSALILQCTARSPKSLTR
jgi:hypothetical protein